MTLSEAIEAATAIVDRYPNGGRDAGKGYLGALASTLMSYPRQVALRCADFPARLGAPLRGISAACKFLPTPADIVAWCERDVGPLYDRAGRAERLRDQFAARAAFEREQTVDRSQRLTVQELKDKYGDWHNELGATTRQPQTFVVRQIDRSEITISPYLLAALARQEAAK